MRTLAQKFLAWVNRVMPPADTRALSKATRRLDSITRRFDGK